MARRHVLWEIRPVAQLGRTVLAQGHTAVETHDRQRLFWDVFERIGVAPVHLDGLCDLLLVQWNRKASLLLPVGILLCVHDRRVAVALQGVVCQAPVGQYELGSSTARQTGLEGRGVRTEVQY